MSSTTTQQNVLQDPRITSFGLFVEANRRVMRAVEAAMQERHGLAMTELEALARMARSPEHQLSMSELADQMVLTSGGATRLVDRLVAAGQVDRVTCPDDRRVQWARLSPSGLRLIKKALVSHLEDLEEHFFSAMSKSDRATVDTVMDRIRSH